MKNRLGARWFVLFFTCLLTGCRVADRRETVPSAFLGVAPSLETAVRKLTEAYQQANPQATPFRIIVLPHDDIPAALDQNRVSAVLQWDEPPVEYWSAAVGRTGILFIVNPQNPLGSITADQARGIFLGLILRWEDLGGSPGAIHRITFEPDLGIGSLLERAVLRQKSIGDDTMVVPTPYAMQREIERDGVSIGYILGFNFSGEVHPLKIDNVTAEYTNLISMKYPFAIPIFLTAKDPASADVLQFAGWAQSGPGQSVFQSMNPWE